MRQKYTKVEALAEVIFARKAVGEIHRSYQSCKSIHVLTFNEMKHELYR